ncbi:MAG: cupin domain-containing protein [Caldilineaceae bacterium]|nr:cupin domain-containing protein [Caldilineaceae bacterium]
MKAEQLLTNLQFHDSVANAQPILVDQHSRIIRWMLKPGQQIEEHKVPGSPFYVVVLLGRGIFAGDGGQEQEFGPGSLLVFEPGELHTVRALNENLVFVSFMESTEHMRPERTGGELGRE